MPSNPRTWKEIIKNVLLHKTSQIFKCLIISVVGNRNKNSAFLHVYFRLEIIHIFRQYIRRIANDDIKFFLNEVQLVFFAYFALYNTKPFE